MKTKKEIRDYLHECEEYIGGNTPMELEDWAHWEGQKYALKWMLDESAMDKRINSILEGAHDNTIKDAQKRLSDKTGFGIPPTQCVDDH